MSIDPDNLLPHLRAAMTRKPALVPPFSAGEFLRATKANPQDSRNAPETAATDRLAGSDACRHVEMNIQGKCVACGKQIYLMPLDQSAGIASQIATTALSCPPEPVQGAGEQGKLPTRVLGHPDSVCFTIPGVVMGKPRMTRRDKWTKRPCVMRYRKWMDAARAFVPKLPADPIDVSWVAYLPFPKSYSKKKQQALGGCAHREKPDRDNIDKGILDFLFKNDAGIAQGCMRKLWDDGYGPRLEITII